MATKSMMAQVIIVIGKPASPPAPLLQTRFMLGTRPELHCSVIRRGDDTRMQADLTEFCGRRRNSPQPTKAGAQVRDDAPAL